MNSCIKPEEVLQLIDLDTTIDKSNATKQITDRLIIDLNSMTQKARTVDQVYAVFKELEYRWTKICEENSRLDVLAFRIACSIQIPNLAKVL